MKSNYGFSGTFALLALWWIALFALGYPRPKYDDVFFAGTAINLAKGQGLFNPLIKTWTAQFESDKYFQQPPFHPYMLSGWIRIFGLSADSMRSFVIASCFGTGVCLVLLGRRLALSWPSVIMASLFTSTYILQGGLRPDAAGLFACGLAALGWTGHSRGAWFVGSIFGASAPLIHPFTAALVLPLGLWSLALKARNAPRWPIVLERIGLSVLAIGLVFALFLVAISGDLSEFWRIFGEHSTLRAAGTVPQWQVLWLKMNVGLEPLFRWPTLGVLLIGILLACLRSASRPAAISAGLFFLCFLFLSVALYAAYLIHVLYLFALLAALFIGGRLQDKIRPAFGLLWGTAALLVVFPGGLVPFFSQSIGTDVAQMRPRLASILQQPGKRLLLDEYAARYVYDWKLPPGAEDWLHCHFPQKSAATPFLLTQKPVADVWVVEAAKLEAYIPDAGVVCPRITLFGYTTSLLLYKDDLRIIP